MHDIPEFDRAARARELTIGVLCALMVIVFYSSFALVSRLGLTSSLGALDLAAVRFGVSGALLLPVVLRYRLQHLRLTDAVRLALLGGLGFVLLCYVGFGLAPAAHGGVLVHGCLPLFTFILIRLNGAGTRSHLEMLGIGLIATGVLMMLAETISTTSPQQLLGDACLLAASLFWASYGMLAARLRVSPLHATALVSCISMCLFLPMYAAWPDKKLFVAPLNDVIVQVIFQGLLIGVGSILAYTRAIGALGPVGIALFSAAVPGLTALIAIPLLGEVPTLLSTAGVAATTIGMLVGLSALRIGKQPYLRVWQAFLQRRREQHELLGMSDRTLRDLGLSRIDALRGARQPWWVDGTEKPRHF
jgi:drug/metabolite transporter (DMT)-like permease/uncharacterized protein YjiS (DUF1127 family)